MGEYANYKGRQIKIGTCEQMYYLRADQVSLITPRDGSINPRLIGDAMGIRFRFPFPDEDAIEPGAFTNYERDFPVYGVEPPEDLEHYSAHFRTERSILLSTPCPRSKAGKESGLKFGYNGRSHGCGVHSQRLVDGKLVLIMQCGDCGVLWRVSTLADAQPIIDALNANDYAPEIAARIVAGYTQPNYWSKAFECVNVAA